MRPLEPERRNAAVEMLAVAFDADPMYRFLFPAAERHRWILSILGGAVAQTAPEGWAIGPEGQGVPAALLYVPPNRYPLRTSRLVGFMLRFPPPWPTGHLLRAGRVVLAAMERLHPKSPHYYVMTVGVHPDHQGKGLARKLLSVVTSRADEECVPTYLETTNPTNLPLYRKLGFEVVAEHVLGAGFPPLWTMQRPSRPSRERADRG